MIQRMKQMLSRLPLVVGMVLGLNACKPKPAEDSSLNAIISADGAIGLIPMRAYYQRTGRESEAMASAIENGLRLQYGLVGCSGADAADQLNYLEDVAAANPENVRRLTRSIVMNNGQAFSKAKSCQVLGQHLFSAASLTLILSENPKTQEVYEQQQMLWLAVRSRYKASGHFASVFYRVLDEGMGALPLGADQQTEASIGEVDKLYNPCAAESAESKRFNRKAIFDCDKATGNYRILPGGKASYGDVVNRLITQVNHATKQFFEDVAEKSNPAVLDGWREGLTTSADLGDVALTKAQVRSSTDISPIIIYLGDRGDRFLQMVRLRLTANLPPVFDPNNPKPVILPGMNANSGGLGLADNLDSLLDQTAGTSSTFDSGMQQQVADASTAFAKIPSGVADVNALPTAFSPLGNEKRGSQTILNKETGKIEFQGWARGTDGTLQVNKYSWDDTAGSWQRQRDTLVKNDGGVWRQEDFNYNNGAKTSAGNLVYVNGQWQKSLGQASIEGNRATMQNFEMVQGKDNSRQVLYGGQLYPVQETQGGYLVQPRTDGGQITYDNQLKNIFISTGAQGQMTASELSRRQGTLDTGNINNFYYQNKQVTVNPGTPANNYQPTYTYAGRPVQSNSVMEKDLKSHLASILVPR